MKTPTPSVFQLIGVVTGTAQALDGEDIAHPARAYILKGKTCHRRCPVSVATVSTKGWVVIPKVFRQQFNLKPGSRVRFVAYRGGLYLFPVSENPIAAMRGMFAGGPSMIDDLLVEHRQELAREEEKLGESLRSG